ncbi:MAG TPA: cobalamin-dependent protein [Xanthobacteraceae bacterium]|jgi:hypothetical protein
MLIMDATITSADETSFRSPESVALCTNVLLRLEPLGLKLVAEATRRAGRSVRLVDLQVETPIDYHRRIVEWQPKFIAFSCNDIEMLPADHARSVYYELPVPQRTQSNAPIARASQLHIHVQRGRTGRSIDDSTERFVAATRVDGSG